MLHTAQDLSYTVLASVNPEDEISSLDWFKAHTAFSQCGFFVRGASSFTGGLRVESSDSPISLNVGTANARSLPSKLAVWSAGSKNLLFKETAMHECIAHCPVCGRKFPIPVLGNLDQKVEIRCVCGHTFRVGIRAHIEVSRDDKRVTVYIKKDKTVVVIRLEPKAALELAIAIAKKARAITEEEKGAWNGTQID